MSIQYEHQTHAQCDICGDWEANTLYKHHMIEKLRAEGWKIGKKVTCPECVRRKKEARHVD